MQFVCRNCFTDKELVGFILSQDQIGDCECCGSKGVEVVSIDELVDFFREVFENFKPDPDGESLIMLIQRNWNLFREEQCGRSILNELLSRCKNSLINSANVAVGFSDEISDNINYWFKLRDELKWERRYLTDIQYLTDELGGDGFFERKVVVGKDASFFRARLHRNANERMFDERKMFCPPKELSTAGRANPMGIPYLYLSDNEETILYEIRASFLDEVSVASFSVNPKLGRNVVISDFTEIPTLFHPNGVNKRIKSTLLKQLISKDLSKPMRRYDSELDYIPTQFICEFIRVFTDVDGIKFKSSLHKFGNNLVIFDQHIMGCTDVKRVQVSAVDIHFENLLN
jgi:hypothetical protein